MGGWKFTDDLPTDDDLQRAFDGVVNETVKASAVDAAAGAPVDTGGLQASVYHTGPDGSNYNEAKNAMQERNGNAGAADELRLGDYEGMSVSVGAVDSAASYADFVQDGYMHFSGRYTAGRPFIRNAMRGQEHQFDQRQIEALHKLGCKRVVKS